MLRLTSFHYISIYFVIFVWTTCQSFSILKAVPRSRIASIKSRTLTPVYSSTNHENFDTTGAAKAIEKLLLKSFVSFGVALTAFSFSSVALDLPASYISEDQSISFKHSEDLIFSPKPLKTHDKEILFKSEIIKGFNAGVTVDRVKIDDITQFATAKGLAQKVVDVEMTKDGVLESIALKWGESKTPISVSNLPAYEIEYKVESTRGKNHYFIKTSVVNKKLYVFTVQCKEDSVVELAETAQSIIDSFKVVEGLNY